MLPVCLSAQLLIVLNKLAAAEKQYVRFWEKENVAFKNPVIGNCINQKTSLRVYMVSLGPYGLSLSDPIHSDNRDRHVRFW